LEVSEGLVKGAGNRQHQEDIALRHPLMTMAGAPTDRSLSVGWKERRPGTDPATAHDVLCRSNFSKTGDGTSLLGHNRGCETAA
jgi:hypothetical protein